MRKNFAPSLLFVALLVVIGLGAARATGSFGSSSPSFHGGVGYWHTSGSTILDARGEPVRVAGVNWYGMDSDNWVPAGLDYQPYTKIMDEVKALGYNLIRLPFSNQLVEVNPVITQKVKANPQFLGRHALSVLDDIVHYAHHIGLKILLDNNRSQAATRLRVNYLVEPLWYTSQFPESSWIDDWVTLARRYKGNTALIGFDLRNEPHTNGPGPWNLHAYLFQGATWGPYNGVDNPSTDWRLAAERAANAVLAVNPHLLMLVEGIQLYPDKTQPGGADSYFWSGILSPVRQYPVVLNVPHQLVYEAHDWGPWKWNMPWYRHMTYASLTAVWKKHWAFLANDANASYAAPVVLGEFGTCTNNPQCVDQLAPDNQATWLHYLLRFLHENPQIGWCFFALDGTNSNDSVADNGLLNARWNGVSNSGLQADLETIQ